VVLSLERKHLEKCLSLEELKCLKVEAQKFEVIEGRSRVKIHSGEAKIFQAIRSRRSSALVSREELSKFCKPEDLEEAE
jgi:hypothetical protein